MINDPVLKRQLKRLGLSESEIPKDFDTWCQFLSRIELTYKDFENSRYTNERTLMIASREMQELFESLENAEKLSKTGHWSYNLTTNQTTWSSEMYRIFKRNPILPGLNHAAFVSYIYREDRKKIEKDWNNAIEIGQGESIFRIVLGTEIRWIHSRYRRKSEKNNPNTIIFEGTLSEITKQKEAELRLAELNSKLIVTAKRAGMAEVASSVLHNIGNVLNSVSISSETIKNIITNTKISNLPKISDLIKENKEHLGEYLITDPKGKIIPEYLEHLSACWVEERNTLAQNLDSLTSHIQHIKEVVARQQSLTGFFGIVQPVSFSTLLDDAISIVFSEPGKSNIQIKRNYNYTNKSLGDKVSYTEIFVNLIRNAKDALDSSPHAEKLLILSIELKNPELIVITIEDNGSGIAAENFKKLFTYGFTTKKMGSGIGLHASILSIREMGGDLKAFSDGVEKGAKFILEVPNKPVV